ncbi:hypothetical protein HER10_EVM0002588 [Colletotrichum scovillei]|uniref:uncharacterized protein n=1 Tax=Colletotrichum scovillei TaxID=1209932 RepID=UPI0015C3F97C|nr:uncharacterized protein HER10_EVM0002588 [Colletotrichum scovillei]KAF4778284.1 hypothetical protein HER10_EVM0002588 [Colletotrichum scovillei]
MPSPSPSTNYPPRGVTAYTSTSGPIHAPNLESLNLLRARPDYESCMPTLTSPELATDWDAHYLLPNPYQNPPTLDSVTNPLRVPQAEIDAIWDPYKLAAMIARSHQDMNILDYIIIEVQREKYDVDRILDDVEHITPSRQYRVNPQWDVYKLREVFSSLQIDVGNKLGRLAHVEAELRRKVLQLNRLL